MGGQTDGLFNTLYNGYSSNLVGKKVTCGGYGNYTMEDRDGNLRTASNIEIEKTNSVFLYLKPNGNGQIPWKGDSGGSCFWNEQGRTHMIGVASKGLASEDGKSVLNALYTIPFSIAGWVDETMFGDWTSRAANATSAPAVTSTCSHEGPTMRFGICHIPGDAYPPPV